MNNKLSRRNFLGSSAAVLATVSLAPMVSSCQTACPSFPGIDDFGSKFGGVQIGATTYSFRNMPAGLENTVKYCRESGISSIELRMYLEEYLGAPENPTQRINREAQAARAAQQSATAAPAERRGRPQLTPEQQAEIDKYTADMKAFRLGLTPEKIATAKKLFDDAGIGIHIWKAEPANWSDEEIDYAFTTARLLGAKGITQELSDDATKRLAPFAEKHKMYAIMHNHGQFAEPGFNIDTHLAVSPAVMLNFDVGHYFGTTGLNPCDFMKKYHDRIYSIHIKDKTGPNTDPANTNQVYGQGQTPIKEILLLIKNEGWPIYVDIELEHDIKPWSNQVKETKTCVQYLRNILI
jgi:sugar phosphate isomerase/epimerase